MRRGRAAQQTVEGRRGVRAISGKNLGTLLVSQAVLTTGIALSFPFFAIYFHRERGLPMGWVGAILGVNGLCGSLASGLAGEFSDLLGRRRVMLLSLLARSASVGLLAWAVHQSWDIAPLVAVLFLTSFVGHFFDPAARGWVADRCAPSERQRAYGLLRIAVNLGWAIGPAVGGLLAQSSFALMFGVTALVCLATAGLVAARIADEPGERAEETFSWSAWLGAADSRFRWVLALSVLNGLVMGQLVISLSVHATQFVGLTAAQVGWLFSLNGILVVLVQYPASRYWARHRLTAVLVAGSAIYAAGFALVGAAGTFAAMCGAMVVVTLGEISTSPAMQSLWANLAPAREKGRFVGLGSFAFHVGTSIGPFLGGLGLEHLSRRHPAAPWAGVAFVAAVAAAGFHALSARLTPEEEGLT
ncbi:MAG: MFS transporter [Elusimicrobia bacterium]|nr:MFS transporter [Elusimicrobiota bacterium]